MRDLYLVASMSLGLDCDLITMACLCFHLISFLRVSRDLLECTLATFPLIGFLQPLQVIRLTLLQEMCLCRRFTSTAICDICFKKSLLAYSDSLIARKFSYYYCLFRELPSYNQPLISPNLIAEHYQTNLLNLIMCLCVAFQLFHCWVSYAYYHKVVLERAARSEYALKPKARLLYLQWQV